MRTLKIVGVSMLALSLVLGLASPVLAAPPDWAPLQVSHLPREILRGEVVDIDAGKTFFVILSQGQELTISVNDDTQYLKAPIPRVVLPLARHLMELRQESQERLGLRQRLHSFVGRVGSFFRAVVPWGVPGLVRHQLELRQPAGEEPELGVWLHPFAEEATFDDLTIGTQVVVRAESGEDNPVAKLVIIIQPTGYGGVVGTITDISTVDKTLTVAPADGGTKIVLSYNEGTRFILRGITKLEVGQSVRAVYDDEMIAKVVFVPVEVP